MQAVAHLIEQYSTQLFPTRDPSSGPARLGSGFDTALEPVAEPVIEPWAPGGPRWSESPVCDSGDDVDEDEAYFLGEDDDDEDDDDYDEDEDDDYDDDDDDNDELDKDEDMDEDDF